MTKITSKLILAIFALWCLLVYALFAVVAVAGGDSKMRAMAGMVSGLLILWVIIGGMVMYVSRNRVKDIVLKIPWTGA